ncbi:MAG: YcaO-like family protein [Minisyncoccia bacterium]
MLRDVVSFDEFFRRQKKDSSVYQARAKFIRFIEERIGGQFTYDAARFPYYRPDLADLFEIAEKMRSRGVLTSYAPRYSLPDEPQYREWRAVYRDGEDSTASGTSIDDDRAALSAALAEANERHMWFETTDHFQDKRTATLAEVQQIGAVIAPHEFAGFTDSQRATIPHLTLRDVPYVWTRAYSLVDDTRIYIPAQVTSGTNQLRARRFQHIEPTILYPITNGLASWPTQEGVRLRGLLETIERDAYMITWQNQLTPPRFSTEALASESPTLAKLVQTSRRYRLEPHFLRLITDAPTYAVMTILEDHSGHAPRFAFGIKANASPAQAAAGALFEALRGRRGARRFIKAGIPTPKRERVGHIDRVLYWADSARAELLAFLIAGEVMEHSEEWRNESEAAHYARLIAWIHSRGYRAVSVPYTQSAKNLTPWHVEFIAVPELQPIYFNEQEPHIGGVRLTEVPRLLGYTPRTEPYTEHPHPFS